MVCGIDSPFSIMMEDGILSTGLFSLCMHFQLSTKGHHQTLSSGRSCSAFCHHPSPGAEWPYISVCVFCPDRNIPPSRRLALIPDIITTTTASLYVLLFKARLPCCQADVGEAREEGEREGEQKM